MSRLNRFSHLAVFLAISVIGAASELRAQSRDTTVRLAGAPRYPAGGSFVKELGIGDANGADEYLFSSIANVLLAKDGTIWLLDMPEERTTPPSLRVFNAQGKYLRSVGRTGDGPGEFRNPTGLAQLPDGRVLLRDITSGRINVYSPEGKSLDTWTFTTRYSWPVRGRDGLRVDATGNVWMPFSVGGAGGSSSAFIRLDGAGKIIDTVATPTLAQPPRQSITITTTTASGATGTTTLGAPFQPSAAWWWHPSGTFMTAVTSSYAVDIRRAPAGRLWKPGDPVLSIRRNAPAVPLAEGERANQRAILEANVNSRPGDRSGPIPEIPRTKPPLRGVQAGEDGRLWVGVAVPSEQFTPDPVVPRPGYPTLPALAWREPTVMDVFEPDGAYVGRVTLPPNVYVMAIKGDVLWAMNRDADRVQYLSRYRVNWGR